MNPMKTDEPTLADKVNELAAQVVQLDLERQAAMNLLGEIVATMTLPRNREYLEGIGQAGIGELLKQFDRWAARYQQLAGGK